MARFRVRVFVAGLFLVAGGWLISPCPTSVAQEAGEGNREREKSTRIYGTVTDTAGRPVVGASVRAIWGGLTKPQLDPAFHCETDAQGRYRMDLPVPKTNELGPYALVGVSCEGKTISRGAIRDAANRKVAKLDLTVRDAKPITVDVLDVLDEPIVGAELISVSYQLDGLQEFRISTYILEYVGVDVPRTGADGKLQIDWLPETDRFKFVVDHPDYARENVDLVTPEVGNLQVTLERGNTISFHVNSKDPALLKEVRASLRRDGDYLSETIPLDSNGHGIIRLKPEQEATIEIDHPEFMAAPRSHHFFEHWKQKDYAFELVPIGKIRGRVVDASTGLPVAQVPVMVADTKNNIVVAFAATDEQGIFELRCPAADSRVLLSRDAEWESKQEFDVSFEGGLEQEVPDFKASVKSEVKGIVIDADGNPAAGVVVTHPWRPGGEYRLTDEHGGFTFSGSIFSDGPVDSIFAMDLSKGHAGVGVAASQPMLERWRRQRTSPGPRGRPVTEVGTRDAMRIQLAPTCSVSGSVLDRHDRPVAGTTVSLSMVVRVGSRGLHYRHQFATVTDQSGRYEFDGLIPGMQYNAEVDKERGPGQVRFTASEGLAVDTLVDDPASAVSHSRLKDLVRLRRMSLPDLDCHAWHNSEAIDLKTLKGKTVVLNFWGTWCGPCKGELPVMRKLHELYHDKGLVVIGVHTGFEYDADAVEQAIEEYGLEYPIGIDSEQGLTTNAFGVNRFPTTMVIDREGRLLGELSRQALLHEISSAIRDLPKNE